MNLHARILYDEKRKGFEHTKNRIRSTVNEMEKAQDEHMMRLCMTRLNKIASDALKQMGEKE